MSHVNFWAPYDKYELHHFLDIKIQELFTIPQFTLLVNSKPQPDYMGKKEKTHCKTENYYVLNIYT